MKGWIDMYQSKHSKITGKSVVVTKFFQIFSNFEIFILKCWDKLKGISHYARTGKRKKKINVREKR